MREAGEGVDGDLWWASTNVTTVVGSSVIGKYFAENHYDYTYVYNWNYITENGTNSNGIICPDGWRLPTMNEFSALCKASGFTGANQSGVTAGHATNVDGSGKNGHWLGPGVANGGSDASKYTYTTDTHIFIPYAGWGYTNSAVSSSFVGQHALFYSSTPTGSSNAYLLYLSNSHVWPQHTHGRTLTSSVRCVADAL